MYHNGDIVSQQRRIKRPDRWAPVFLLHSPASNYHNASLLHFDQLVHQDIDTSVSFFFLHPFPTFQVDHTLSSCLGRDTDINFAAYACAYKLWIQFILSSTLSKMAPQQVHGSSSSGDDNRDNRKRRHADRGSSSESDNAKRQQTGNLVPEPSGQQQIAMLRNLWQAFYDNDVEQLNTLMVNDLFHMNRWSQQWTEGIMDPPGDNADPVLVNTQGIFDQLMNMRPVSQSESEQVPSEWIEDRTRWQKLLAQWLCMRRGTDGIPPTRIRQETLRGMGLPENQWEDLWPEEHLYDVNGRMISR
ncbi:hypothetical protein BCR34DRAFT_607090 [Clohesyomyces aquaticus]|uniref:Uncharacterized protein n=1 Tax=Clohesyomyces aquaticus TaxID=1231657 RepID=A0A1Y1YK29_9PLEO|nr:hypothetical protein BCR34DRAFT_607090 [Clohesyomyces aquaticus]